MRTAKGWRTDIPASRSITRVLPRQSGEVKHQTALHYSQVPEALDGVRESRCHLTTRLALEFLMLTASRSGEVRLAQRKEVDWENCL